MDDDLNNLIADFNSSGVSQLNNHQEHPRFREFKNEDREKKRQRERRQEALERQKNSREDLVMKLRGIFLQSGLSHSNEPRKSGQLQEFYGNRKNKNFADQLMTSEWLVDIPEDFEKWIMVLCPKARRCLIVATQGVTTAYSKNGNVINQFPSHLPGGNNKKQASLTILDCFISNTPCQNQENSTEFQKLKSSLRTIWALDVICWNDNSFSDSEFDCRQFLLKSRLEENTSLQERNKDNPYAIVNLPWCICKKEFMIELLNKEFDFELDGILFYHPEVIYIPGQNAMIGWLEPWMCPEIIGVPIPNRLKKREEQIEQAKDYMARFESEKLSMYTGVGDRYSGRLNVQRDAEMSEQNSHESIDHSESDVLNLSINT